MLEIMLSKLHVTSLLKKKEKNSWTLCIFNHRESGGLFLRSSNLGYTQQKAGKKKPKQRVKCEGK